MSTPGPLDDDFDPTHPSVWLIPTPGRQAMTLAGIAKLAPIHHLWLRQRFSTEHADRSLAAWSMLPVVLVAIALVRAAGPVALILTLAITATMAIVAPPGWTEFRRRRILRDHGLVEPASFHARFASEDYPLVRLAELGAVALVLWQVIG